MPHKDIYKRRQANRESYARNKETRLAAHKRWHENNKEKHTQLSKRWIENNKERFTEKNKAWKEANKERVKSTAKKYWESLSEDEKGRREERRRQTEKIYRKNNRDKINKAERRRSATDINFRLAKILRQQLREGLKGRQKTAKAIGLLGTTMEAFKVYISRLFRDGMSWENHGSKGWHIDHIKPLLDFLDIVVKFFVNVSQNEWKYLQKTLRIVKISVSLQNIRPFNSR